MAGCAWLPGIWLMKLKRANDQGEVVDASWLRHMLENAEDYIPLLIEIGRTCLRQGDNDYALVAIRKAELLSAESTPGFDKLLTRASQPDNTPVSV